MYHIKYIKYKAKYLELRCENNQTGGQKEIILINMKTQSKLKFIHPNEKYGTNIKQFIIEMNNLHPTTHVKFYNISIFGIEYTLNSKKEIYYDIITTLTPNTDTLNALNKYFNQLSQLIDNTLYVFSMFSCNLDPKNHIRNIDQQLPLKYVIYAIQNNMPLHIILIDMGFIPEIIDLYKPITTTTTTTTLSIPIIDKPQTIQQVYDYLEMDKQVVALFDDLYIAEFTKNPNITIKSINPTNTYIEIITNELDKLNLNLNDLQIKITVIGIELEDYGNNTFIKMANKIEALKKFLTEKQVIIQAFDGTVYATHNINAFN